MKAATASSTVPVPKGRAPMSPTAAGGLAEAFHPSMSGERSTATGLAPRARSAELAAPAPASRTTRPDRGWGLNATIRSAMGL